MKNCENCKQDNDGSYGSGRFCSTKGARSFSTKAKRKEINEKGSKTLSNAPLIKKCKQCGCNFNAAKKSRLFCSVSCASIDRGKNESYRKLLSKKMKGKNIGSNNGMFGKSPTNTKLIMVTSNKHTKKSNFYVRSSYEEKYVKMLNEDDSVTHFTYEPKQFRTTYEFNGKLHTYMPDFLINDNLIVEIKNEWNATLKETTIKSDAFMNTFDIDYQILILS